MDNRKIAKELVKLAKEITAKSGDIITSKGLLDFVYSPFDSELQIGIGGEWWSGNIKMGKNVFRHRKERIDEAYKPVTIYVRPIQNGLAFDIMGGFLDTGMTVYVDAQAT